MNAAQQGAPGQLTTEDLRRAAGAVDAVVAAIGAAQWAMPTPCEGWSVAELVRHLAAGNRLFVSALGGGPGGGAGESASPSLAADYLASSAELITAFERPGALEKVVTVPFGTVPGAVALQLRVTELLGHGWDLVQSTGQAAEFPADVAEKALAFSAPALARIPPDRTPFGPPQPVDPDATALDRLAACLGRRVTDAASDASG
jgi:uncharacterized protein (TIGR03086 family)